MTGGDACRWQQTARAPIQQHGHLARDGLGHNPLFRLETMPGIDADDASRFVLGQRADRIETAAMALRSEDTDDDNL